LVLSAAGASHAAASSDVLRDINQFWLDRYPETAPTQPPEPDVSPGGVPDASRIVDVLAAAPVDDCFYGIGDPLNGTGAPPCRTGGVPKVNGSYVWGMAKSGESLWWGTLANAICTVLKDTIGTQITTQNNAFVCEGAAGTGGVPGLGDWRLPEIYRHDLVTGGTVRQALSGAGLSALQATTGLRAVGAANDVVLLAGPAHSEEAVYVFAFRGSTGDFLGSTKLTDYYNVRGIAAVADQLYMTVAGNDGNGRILRWTGNLANPLTFATVGIVPDQQAAFSVAHDGYLYVSTWPEVRSAAGVVPGIYRSPVKLSGDGSLPTSSAAFTRVFGFDDYEPDTITARSYAGGAMASFRGYLYFGTMHFPVGGVFAALRAHQACQATPTCAYNLDIDDSGTLEAEEILAAFLGTYRATSVFRLRNDDVELVYGMPALPRYDPATRTYLDIVPNNLPEPEPQLGFSGFNDFFNLYSWTMAVHDGQLFVGTFDWIFLLGTEQFASDGFRDAVNAIIDSGVMENIDPDDLAEIRFPLIFPGADLYRFDNTRDFARPEAIGGLGNVSNYGIRTMVADRDLWLGTANPMNLLAASSLAAPGTAAAPQALRPTAGGWEFIRLRSPQAAPVPSLGAWATITLVLAMLGLGARRAGRRRA
jgi:hypothetical protein